MKALITADWHLRADRPRCRTDEDWIRTQGEILAAIVEAANTRGCPVCAIGDLFHSPQVPSRILGLALSVVFSVHYGLYVIAGQHDLPYHNWDNVGTASFGILRILQDAEHVHHLHDLGRAAHFGQEIAGPENGIVFVHQLTFPDVKDMPPNVDAMTAAETLDAHPGARWIFTGDYHRAFHYEHNGRHVVNPGCITRQAADFKDYQPRVCYVDTEVGTVEWIDLPDVSPVVVDEYLRDEQAREDRITAFVESVRNSGTMSLDFLGNLNAAIQANPDLEPGVVRTIHNLIESEG